MKYDVSSNAAVADADAALVDNLAIDLDDDDDSKDDACDDSLLNIFARFLLPFPV